MLELDPNADSQNQGMPIPPVQPAPQPPTPLETISMFDVPSPDAPVVSQPLFQNQPLPPAPPVYPKPGEPGYDPRLDPARVEHWQSRYDREVLPLRQQVQELQMVAPIAEAINRDPELLNIVRTRMYAQPIPGQQVPFPGQAGMPPGQPSPVPIPQAPAVEQLVRPAMPSKPQGFSLDEAEADRNSASGKYVREMQKYQIDLTEYQSKRQEQLETAETQRNQEVQNRQVMQQRLGQLSQMLITQKGATQPEVMEFIQRYSRDESFDIDTLWDFYKYQKTRVLSPDVQRRVQEMNQVRAGSPLPPLFSMPGAAPPPAPQLSEDERLQASFNDGLMSQKRTH